MRMGGFTLLALLGTMLLPPEPASEVHDALSSNGLE